MSNSKFYENCEDPNQIQHVQNVNDHITASPQQTIERYLENKKKNFTTSFMNILMILTKITNTRINQIISTK